MGKELFAGRKIDPGTRILSTGYRQEDGYDLLLEEWAWEGIKAKSLIFISDQIHSLSDRQIEDFARRIMQLSDTQSVTLKRKEDFTFFNFDFKP